MARVLDAGPLPAWVRWPLYCVALGVFVGIVSARGGPPPASVDTYSVVRPVAALSEGHLTAAARASVYPQPPGYTWLASPLVALARPWIGSATWCSDQPLPSIVSALHRPCTATTSAGEPSRPRPPPWYRSQGVLGLLAWIVLALGAVSLLRASGRGRGVAEVTLVAALTALPAASNAVVQTYHPQDLVCVGLVLAGTGLALRRRWLATGAVMGLAFLCKQFAVLALVGVLAALPGWRERVRAGGAAAAVVLAGLLPFFAVDPSQTWRDLSDTYASTSTVIRSGTVLGLRDVAESTKLLVSRDGAIVMALATALWARWRAGARLAEPGPLVGLVTACLAFRLVFELNITSYYFLAAGAALLCLDLVAGRWPVRSLTWIVVSSLWIAGAGGSESLATQATVFLALSAAVVVIGLAEVWRAGAVRDADMPAGRSATVGARAVTHR